MRPRLAPPWLRAALPAGAAVLLVGCEGALDPAGRHAQETVGLWWLMFWLSVGVMVLVTAVMIAGVARARRRATAEDMGGGLQNLFILGGGVALPLVVVGGLMVASVTSATSLFRASAEDALRIEVHAHQWWWEVRYPDQGDGGVTAFTTANEIHIPTGEEVHIDLTSEDVIHSLWVPQLSGKMDLVPGKTNTMYLEATEDGTYQGMCAEFCGLQHARMRFLVVAQPRAEFDAWAAAQAEPAGPPSEADGADGGELLRGQQVFLGSACVYCHTIQGTSASGTVGPDLTHLGSRATLAGGTIENTPANLAQWVANPPSIKPGTQMPPTSLSGDALNALLAYLESLE